MTSRFIPLRRLRSLDQLDEATRRHPDRVASAVNLDSRDAVIIDPYDLTRKDDAIAYLGGVRGFRGSFSHEEYLAQSAREAR